MDAFTNTQSHASARLTYGISEAAAAFGISRWLMYSLIERNQVRTVRIGARRLIPVAELQRISLTGSQSGILVGVGTSRTESGVAYD